MSDQEKYTEDLLRHYIGPEKIEKAPEGFTSKVMSAIQTGKSPVKASGRLRTKSLVPAISAAVTLGLIASAFLIPGKGDSMSLPVLEFLKNIKVLLPQIDLTSFFRINVPLTLIYGIVGILILSLLDRALYGVFHREK
jgi:hypothetical protein